MNSLESVVLPLEQSRALVEKGIVLETAFVWVNEHEYDHEAGQFDGCHLALIERSAARAEHEAICSAPTLGELLDAIRAVAHPVFLGIDGLFWTVRWVEPSNGMPLQERSTSEQNDLFAAAALLMEASK